jgi:RNA polymerase sigma factor (sigma-70 family)
MEHADTASLVDAARHGDQGAWDDLVERFLPLVFGTMARLGLFGAEAEDVNQTVWLRLVEHLDQIREPRALPGWIVTTTRNESLRSFDKGRRMVPTDPQTDTQLDVPAEGEPADELLAAERQQALLAALEELPEDRRELLLLLVTDPPVPYAEISRRLDIPVGSIGPTRARALEQLRRTDALRGFLAESPTEQRR